MTREDFLLSDNEMNLATDCLEMALEAGARKAKVSIDKSLMELYKTLDGELDNVSRCLDRTLSLGLYVDGKYGSFSTNKLSTEDLRAFIAKATQTVRMLAEDRFNDLPDPERTVKNAVTGDELCLFDDEYTALTSDERLRVALEASAFNEYKDKGLISEEGEYSDSVFDKFMANTDGLRARHLGTSFDYGVESTVRDAEGNKLSAVWWDSSSRLKDLDPKSIAKKAYERAMAQIGPKPINSGKYGMVVEASCASKLVNPLFSALNAYSIQQNNSFLMDSLGKKVFGEGLTIIDEPHRKGETGSKLFDAEGVATSEAPIIKDGVVSEYFVSTYMANKTGLAPTVSAATRPVLKPFGIKGGRDEIMAVMGEGILVTDFNGGNSNPTTGAFSFGVSGFAFKDGKIIHPVREALITGDLVTLWNNLLMAGDDTRACMSKLIPTLAFSNVDFSA